MHDSYCLVGFEIQQRRLLDINHAMYHCIVAQLEHVLCSELLKKSFHHKMVIRCIVKAFDFSAMHLVRIRVRIPTIHIPTIAYFQIILRAFFQDIEILYIIANHFLAIPFFFVLLYLVVCTMVMVKYLFQLELSTIND